MSIGGKISLKKSDNISMPGCTYYREINLSISYGGLRREMEGYICTKGRVGVGISAVRQSKWSMNIHELEVASHQHACM